MHSAAHQPTHTRPHTHTRAVTSQVADVLTLCTLIASDLAEGRSCCKREREKRSATRRAHPFPLPSFPLLPLPLHHSHLSLWSVAAEIINNFLLICNCFWPCSHRMRFNWHTLNANTISWAWPRAQTLPQGHH